MSDRRPFGRVLRLGGVKKDLDEELSFHFEETVRELESRGWSGQAAREEARRRFGDERAYRVELERIDRSVAAQRRWWDRFEIMGQTFRYALRSLARSPGLTLGIVLAFALGIGANATMFGIVERLLLRPPEHIEAPAQVKRVFIETYVDFMGERFLNSTVTYPDYVQLKRARAFAPLSAYTQRTMTVGRGLAATEAQATWATADFFPMLGVKPLLGRFYDASEDRIGGAPLAVLGYGYWRREYGGTRDVLGKTIDFGYGPYTIVGVAPKGFTGVGLDEVDLFLPFHVVAGQVQSPDWENAADWSWFQMVGRLAPNTTVTQAMAEGTALHLAQRREDIEKGEYGTDPKVILGSVIAAQRPATGNVRGGVLTPGQSMEPVVSKLLFAVAGVVLLIACINVANLLLARMIRQRREVAVRLALGISRRRLVGQIVLEGLLLGVLGGVAALLVAYWGGDVIRRLLLPDVAWDQFGLTSTVVGFVVLLALAAGTLSAVIPAVQATRGELASSLRQAGAGGVTRGTARVRIALALVQTTLSVVLLIGAGLFVRSLAKVQSADLGFEAEGLMYVLPRAQRGTFTEAEELALFTDAIERLARVPGVEHVAGANALPFFSHTSRSFSAEGHDSIVTPKTGGPYVHGVTRDYFPAMGLQLKQGRAFTAADVPGSPPVALLGETMARSLWPTESPLGKCIRVGGSTREENRAGRCIQVVGVVEDARRESVRAEEVFQYYLSLEQRALDSIPRYLVARVTEETPAVIEAIRREALTLDPRVRWVQVEPMQELLAPELRSWKLGATMFSVFGLLALLVAAIGLYSVLAFEVAQRTRELGVRAALGASRPSLVRLVVKRALATTSIGVTVGIVIALALVSRMEPLLFEIPPRDPITFAAVIVTLHVVAAIASSFPGWRAAAADPSTALRAE